MAGKRFTPEEMALKIKQLTPKAWPYLQIGLQNAANNVEGEAKKNCTPGESPYYKAPYTQDNDPRREPPHMRDVTTNSVEVSADKIVATISNPKHYALAVHDGTSRMQARPFILDAIKAKQDDTTAHISDAIIKGLRAQCV
jgi:hypothetical protein